MSHLAETLVPQLFEEGIRALFGVPGSGASYDVITEVQRRGGAYYGASHEGAAAIMAGAFARQSDTVGCSISIKGPGLANMLPGIVSNHFEQIPAISIAEAAGAATPSGRVHKRMDQQRLVSGIVKAYGTPGEGESPVMRMLQLAREEVPGPVHLDLAAGEAASLVEFPSPDPGTATSGWRDVVAALAKSSRPLVIVGALGRRAPWRARLAELRIPVFTTLSAKGVVDERLPNAAGVFTGDGKSLSPELRLMREADLVIGLGLRNYEILNPGAITSALVLIDRVASSGSVGFATSVAYSRASDSDFEDVFRRLAERAWGQKSIAEAREALERRLLDHPWLPATIFRSLEDAASGSVFVADTGSFCTIAEHVWRASEPKGFLCSANGRYMGTSVPMAIGAALANPGRSVICAMGDGGVRTYFAELKLAVEHKLPILFVLLADGTYASIAASVPSARRREDILSMPNPSWFRAANALGCKAEYVDSLSSLAAALRLWRTDGGPRFIEAAFDREAYLNMTADLR